jgi:uncharacterized protein (DUF924 family)
VQGVTLGGDFAVPKHLEAKAQVWSVEGEDPRIGEIFAYWFHLVDAGDKTVFDRKIHGVFWFIQHEFVDSMIRNLFGETVEAAQAFQLTHWAETDRGTVALLVVLDQFSRNIFRGSPKQFHGDDLAFRIASRAIDGGILARLPRYQQLFVIFPLTRQESIPAVTRGIELTRSLAKGARAAGDPASNVDFYGIGVTTFSQQLQLLQRFGRFPVRNLVLHRENTSEEAEYLNSADRFFSTGA